MKDSKKVTKKSPAVKVEEKFIEEENDNRVIIFIAITILVIIGTIIGLLVGCAKQSEEKDPVKPKDDIVVPDTKEEDKKEDKETTVIKKVTTKANNTKEETYIVSFNLLDEDDVYTVEVKNGKVSPYVPNGYTSCKYYADENLTKEFDFTNKITSNTNIYTSCSIAVYTIIYDKDTNSQTEYDLKEGKVALSDANLEKGFFEGWYTTPDFSGDRVYYLSKDLTKIANEQNEIRLYAKVADSYSIRYHYKGGEVDITLTYDSQKEMPIRIENYGGNT